MYMEYMKGFSIFIFTCLMKLVPICSAVGGDSPQCREKKESHSSPNDPVQEDWQFLKQLSKQRKLTTAEATLIILMAFVRKKSQFPHNDNLGTLNLLL